MNLTTTDIDFTDLSKHTVSYDNPVQGLNDRREETTENQTITVSAQAAINITRRQLKHIDRVISDEELLDQFIIVNWATINLLG